MSRVLLPLALAAMLAAAAAPAAQAAGPQAACEVAEVNPVTGHAVCVKPLGAPVAQPSPDLMQACDPSHQHDPDFSFGPNCKSAKPGS